MTQRLSRPRGFILLEALVAGDYRVTAEADERHLMIHVADNGCGIPPENLDKIFNPFFTTKPAGQGTGLGLSLGYQMARSQGGSLVAENRHNEVVFRLTLPAGL